MSSFDPMAAAIDWLDAYRASDLSIADLYSESAALECCNGQATVVGRAAITELAAAIR
jgi:ketosteroid isomerase-like protein